MPVRGRQIMVEQLGIFMEVIDNVVVVKEFVY
jgi:hypothetical protein